MKRLYLVTNTIKDPERKLTAYVEEFITGHGGTCLHGEVCPPDAEGVIVLGGDGTVLKAAADVRDLDIPILGINLGRIGYLTEVERSSWQESILRVLTGDYEIESRMLLECSFDGRDHMALNDVVFARSGVQRTLSYDVYVNGQFLNSYHADGLIVATPTGSTAYNLSAGGPIVEPSADLILLTPICPHTLNNRSVIFSGNDYVTIEIGYNTSEPMLEAQADFDGEEIVLLKTGDRVTIKRSDRVTRLIRLNRRSFLETLHAKMSSV